MNATSPNTQKPTVANSPMATGAAAIGLYRPEPEPYIDKVEVAKRLGKTTRCLDQWMKRGFIPFFRINRSVCFKWSDVESHLAATCRVSPRS